MGSYTSKEEKKVDEGYSYTSGLYSSVVQDYDENVVRKLITSRKLAPFYKGRDEVDTPSENTAKTTTNKPSSSSASPKNKHAKINQSMLYADAVECPICFLYYPSNINYSKCCDQPICTECFVQIKRTDPLLPPCCPFCVQPNFGIIYQLPSSSINRSPQRYSTLFSVSSPGNYAIMKNITTRSTSGHTLSSPSSLNDKSSKHPPLNLSKEPTRRSLAKQKPSMIVLVDQIRPTVNKSATASAAVPAASPLESSLPIRRYYATDLTMETPSFEDWMIMEAVRRSLQDQQNTQTSSSNTTSLLPHQTTNTPLTSEDSSIVC
ncbi:hypothetical protein BCR42DRAFT_406899 [Absidia repens]|uniref:RING-type domain-containing protein n=1 Tax=Absidia repens TaxID=90262 RepID=A0A1X2IRH5_9FUNG|nr:hypothetical protein BCR42DRAFT_406899 [Absidia repens]